MIICLPKFDMKVCCECKCESYWADFKSNAMVFHFFFVGFPNVFLPTRQYKNEKHVQTTLSSSAAIVIVYDFVYIFCIVETTCAQTQSICEIFTACYRTIHFKQEKSASIFTLYACFHIHFPYTVHKFQPYHVLARNYDVFIRSQISCFCLPSTILPSLLIKCDDDSTHKLCVNNVNCVYLILFVCANHQFSFTVSTFRNCEFESFIFS